MNVSVRTPFLVRSALLLGFITQSALPFTPYVTRADTTPSTQVQLTLPAPTGPYLLGTISLHLVDDTRQDPFWSTAHNRELMVTLWFPLDGQSASGSWRHGCRQPRSPTSVLASKTF
jgi:hypothetical protein